MTVLGWDASDFDWGRGPMDLAAAAAAGIAFFTHKATEGTSVKHVHFGEAMRRARDAGIPVLGAYHVVRSPRNAQAEVNYFLAYLDAQTPWRRTHPAFFIQVDLEKWPYDSVPAAEGEDFADLAEAQTGKTAIIYASKGQYRNELAGTSHELWNANYPLGYQTGDFRDLYRRAGGDSGPGWTSYSGKTPAIWQYTSSAVIGRQPTCDANAFRGTLADLRALITGGGIEDMAADFDAASRIAGLPYGALMEDIHQYVVGGRPNGDDPVGRFRSPNGWRMLVDRLGGIDQAVGELRAAVTELRSQPPGSVVISDEQLERVLRRVIGSVDDASPAQG